MSSEHTRLSLGPTGRLYQVRMIDGVYYLAGVESVRPNFLSSLIDFVGSERTLTISAQTLILFIPVA